MKTEHAVIGAALGLGALWYLQRNGFAFGVQQTSVSDDGTVSATMHQFTPRRLPPSPLFLGLGAGGPAPARLTADPGAAPAVYNPNVAGPIVAPESSINQPAPIGVGAGGPAPADSSTVTSGSITTQPVAASIIDTGSSVVLTTEPVAAPIIAPDAPIVAAAPVVFSDILPVENLMV